MPKLDGLKEDLITLRFWLGVVVASILGIVGWLVTNFQNTEIWFLVVGAIALVCLLIVCLMLMRSIKKTINQIRKVKK